MREFDPLSPRFAVFCFPDIKVTLDVLLQVLFSVVHFLAGTTSAHLIHAKVRPQHENFSTGAIVFAMALAFWLSSSMRSIDPHRSHQICPCNSVVEAVHCRYRVAGSIPCQGHHHEAG